MISLKSLRRFIMIAILASSTVHAAEPQSLDRTLEPYLEEFGLPALAAAVFKEGVVVASGVVTERIIEPLGLKSAGFGPQASLGKVDAPLGHT